MLKAGQNHYFLAGIGEDARIFLSEADCPIDSPVQGFEFLDDAQIHLMFETGYSQEVCRPIRHILTAEEKAEKAKAEALEREIARVKRELNGASEGVEKYILMLEENRANLEKEIQDKNIEITTLKQARDENVRRLSRQFDYDLEQHEKMFTDEGIPIKYLEATV